MESIAGIDVGSYVRKLGILMMVAGTAGVMAFASTQCGCSVVKRAENPQVITTVLSDANKACVFLTTAVDLPTVMTVCKIETILANDVAQLLNLKISAQNAGVQFVAADAGVSP